MKVNLQVKIDVQEAYNQLSNGEKSQFIFNNIEDCDSTCIARSAADNCTIDELMDCFSEVDIKEWLETQVNKLHNQANFSDRLTNLICKCYDAIAEIVKNKAQESAYINEGESVYSLRIDNATYDDSSSCHIVYLLNAFEYTSCWINQIDYHDYGSCGWINLISEDGTEISIDTVLDIDICAITDYIIKHYE